MSKYWPKKCSTCSMRQAIYLIFILLGSSSETFAQQDPFQLVIGRGYIQRSLVCNSSQAREALLSVFRSGRQLDAFPDGCSFREVNFVPEAKVQGSQARMPTRRQLSDGSIQVGSVPGEFMAARLLEGAPARVFIFYPTERMRLVDANGREPQAIQASFGGSEASLNSNHGSSGGLWAPDGGPVGSGGYAPSGTMNAVERYERPETSVVETIDGV
jgi:hypothetical protein